MSASVDLTGQVALVTGASAGLGRQFARVLASAGATVAVGARRVERLEELRGEIEADGGRCVPVALDMTAAERFPAVLDEVEASAGPVTILVNNAGVPDGRHAHKLPLDLTYRVIDTNLRGPWVLSCEVARRLIAAEQPGRIVNISSMAAYHYPEGAAAALYSVTKAAIARMTEVLAVEWARYGINVNGIAPGLFSSEMTDRMIDKVGDPSSAFPRKRIGDPAQLDSTLLYLVSPSSELVTGTVIRVDDGQHPR